MKSTRGFHWLCGIVVLTCSALMTASVTNAAEMKEASTDSRTFAVVGTVSVKGMLKTPTTDPEKPNQLPLDLQGAYGYKERRLPSSGQDARAFRSLRTFDTLTTVVTVGQQKSEASLPVNVKRVVVEGFREGQLCYSPDAFISRSTVDLLSLPGDSLTALTMLPNQDVPVEGEYRPESWVMQMWAGFDAMESSELNCQLLSIKQDQATLQFTGKAKGAIDGAISTLNLKGEMVYDLKQKCVVAVKATQKENRTISAVSPGLDVTATIAWTRQPAGSTNQISEADLKDVTLDPSERIQWLSFRPKGWDLQMYHDRNWHVFQSLPQTAVLRLINEGNLICQCNIARLTAARPGQHVSEDQFVSDIKTSLGAQFKELTEAGQIESNSGRYLFRAVAKGGSETVEMNWVYYLCADPNGKQMSFVFSVEPENMEAIAGRDLLLVESVRFDP